MTAVEEYLTGALIAGFVVAALFVVRVAQALHRHYREAFEIASDLLPDSRTTVRASSPAAAEARPQSPVDAGDPRHPASTGSTRKAAS